MPDTQWRNSTSRTAACLVLDASEKWKRSPFWGTQFGLDQGNPGWLDVSASYHPTPTPTPKHGATARSDHGQHKVSGPRQRATSPKASTAWTLPSGATFPLIPWTSHHHATTSHDKQPGLFPERQGAASADSPWENRSGACVFISRPGWGLNRR